MNILLVISWIIILTFAIYGLKKGFVKMLIPVLSGILTIILLIFLKDWLFKFLFQWTFFQGEHIVARIVVILLIYFAGALGFKWLLGILKILTKLPLVHGLNKILGFFLGVAEGFLALWLLLYIIEAGQGRLLGFDFSPMIAQNSFLSRLYEHNLLSYLMTALFGSWL